MRLLCLAAALLCCGVGNAYSDTPPDAPLQCIAPAKPGGGFDLTCRLVGQGLGIEQSEAAAMPITYMPGGVGAVAYNTIIDQHAAEPATFTAFSSGSLLNLALGKFGHHDEKAVRWLAAVGNDYAVISVPADSPYHDLPDLMTAVKKSPSKVLFGTDATIGGQDWMRIASLARTAGIDPRKLNYVVFEGGGEGMVAMLASHVDAMASNLGEVSQQLEDGRIRILAVLTSERLPGKFSAIPTAREQGYNLTWPTLRGVYMGPEVDDRTFEYWQARFQRMLSSAAFDEIRERSGMFPLALTGNALEATIHQQVEQYRELATEFGLMPSKR
jgi:putative tricarboxylic transport membrane protein